MRRSSRRLTLVLTTLLLVVLAAGATAAWSFGAHRERQPVALAEYHSGPSADRNVRLSAAAGADPRAGDVLAALRQYFGAINNRDYESWVDAVAAEQSAPQTEQQWVTAYASTVDSNLMVMTIANEPIRARMMFTSEQAVELAPPSLPVTCINWDITYLLDEQDDHLVLSGIDPSAQSMAACQ